MSQCCQNGLSVQPIWISGALGASVLSLWLLRTQKTLKWFWSAKREKHHLVYRIFGTVAFLSSLLAFWQRWLIAGLWFLFFFLLFFFFFSRQNQNVTKGVSTTFLYLWIFNTALTSKKKKKKRWAWVTSPRKKKAWALNNEMPLSLCCTAGDLAWKSPCVEEQQSRSSSQCWRQPHPRFALWSLKWQLLGLVLTFNQYFMDCHVLMKLEIFAFCIWLLHMWFISSQEKLWNCVLILKGSLAFYSFRGLITLNRRVQSSVIHEEIKEAQHYY